MTSLRALSLAPFLNYSVLFGQLEPVSRQTKSFCLSLGSSLLPMMHIHRRLFSSPHTRARTPHCSLQHLPLPSQSLMWPSLPSRCSNPLPSSPLPLRATRWCPLHLHWPLSPPRVIPLLPPLLTLLVSCSAVWGTTSLPPPTTDQPSTTPTTSASWPSW
jgi:hypothetical protein